MIFWNFYLNKSQRYKGLVPEHCSLLLGPEHALLREEFYEVKKHLRKRDGNVRHILVFYGGSDFTDETSKAIQALVLLYKECNKISVDVVTGQSNPHKQKVEELCSQHDFIQYYCQVDNMAELMNIPVLGIVENYSYFECPNCHEKHHIYGESHLDEYAAKHGLKVLDRLPIDPKLAALCDKGIIELFENDYLKNTADTIETELA